MTEHIEVKLEDDVLFDDILANSLPEGGDLQFIVKRTATNSGQPAVMITFTVMAEGEEEPRRVQVVTTYALLKMAMATLEGELRGY